MAVDSVKKIGRRIAHERKVLGLTQSLLAERVEISRGRLASYEEGRGSLRCGIAFDICRNLIISEKWLATGEGNKDLYLDVSRIFPDTLKDKPFIEQYSSRIEKLYKAKEGFTNGKIHFIWSVTDHPETLELACFKHQKIFSDGITDKLSQVYYWMKLADYARSLSEDYSLPPRERMNNLNDRRILCDDGTIVPFSYKRFYDDLKLIGLSWVDIQGLAEEVTSAYGREEFIPILDMKKMILSHLQGIDLSDGTNYSTLYEKLHMQDEK